MSGERMGVGAFRRRARDEAERYGGDRWVFVRELVQNARDAGATRVLFDVGRTPDGGERITVADDGDGMSLEHARRFLFTLYASSKRDRRDAAGRFGVGFWSVLRYEPDAVTVRSRSAGGDGWQVRLSGALEEAEIGSAPIGSGTEIVLERRPAGDDTADRIRAAVHAEARLVRQRDRPDRPLEIVVDGRPAAAGTELAPPLIRFRRRGLRGAVAFGDRPLVELSVRGFRVRTVAALADLRPQDSGRRRRRAAGLADGLAPRVVLDSDRLEVLMSRGEARDGRELERIVRTAERELGRLVRRELDRLAPTPAHRRAVESVRAAFGAVGSRALAVAAVAAVALALIAAFLVVLPTSDRGERRAVERVPAPAGGSASATALYRPLDGRYRGLSVGGVGEIPADAAIRYRPGDRALLIGGLRVRGVEPSGRVTIAPVRASEGPGIPCGGGCVELTVVYDAPAGPLRLPFPAGTVVDPETVRLDGRPVAVAWTAAGEPTVELARAGTGELRYGAAPGPEPPPSGTGGWPPLPTELRRQAALWSSRPPAEAADTAVELVRRRVAYDRGPALAVRYGLALRTGRSVVEAALELGAGDCDVQNMLVASLLETAGIPARLAIGWIGVGGTAVGGLHAWAEYRDADGVWRAADASVTAGTIPAAATVTEDGGTADAWPPSPPLPAGGRRGTWAWMGALAGAGAAGVWTVFAWRRRRLLREHEDGDGVTLSQLVDGAVRRPEAWRGAAALAERPLLATWGTAAVSLRRARREAARGRLYAASDPVAAALASAATVLDQRRPECRAAADGLGAPDLDRWRRMLEGVEAHPLLRRAQDRLATFGVSARLALAEDGVDGLEVLAPPGETPSVVVAAGGEPWRRVGVSGCDGAAVHAVLEEVVPALLPPAAARRVLEASARRTVLAGEVDPVRAAAEELLAIDVDAELAAVGSEEVHGPWQVPAELVRMCLRLGAGEVVVESRRRGFRLVAADAEIAARHLRALASCLDRRLDGVDRHAHLRQLEDDGALPLLWAASVEGAALVARGGGTELQLGRKGEVELAGRAGGRVRGLELELGAPAWPRRRAADWLRSAARFAPVPVRLDGVDLRSGFGRSGWRVAVERPLPATVLVGCGGDAPSLWLLQHGVVSTRATVPGYPPFAAALELGPALPGPATPAALRAAATPYLRLLAETAVAAMLRVVETGDAGGARRLLAPLVAAAEAGVLRDRVLAAPLIERRGPADGGRVPLAELDPWARRAGGAVPACDPGDRRAAGGPVDCVVLGPDDRVAVNGLLGVRFRAAHRPGGPRWPEVRARILERIGGLLERLPRGLGAVPEAEWSDAERALLSALRREYPAADPAVVGFHRGRFGRGRAAGGGVLLPRRAPTVQAAGRLVAADPRWTAVARRALRLRGRTSGPGRGEGAAAGSDRPPPPGV